MTTRLFFFFAVVFSWWESHVNLDLHRSTCPCPWVRPGIAEIPNEQARPAGHAKLTLATNGL